MSEVERFGSYDVTLAEVIDFARRFDPQPFHLDPEAAAKTYFGALAASGWHTAAMTMRMLVDHMDASGLVGEGAFGIDHLRWLKPVHPGDRLRCERTILSTRSSRSRPGLVIQTSRVETLNQHNDVVLRFDPIEMVSETVHVKLIVTTPAAGS